MQPERAAAVLAAADAWQARQRRHLARAAAWQQQRWALPCRHVDLQASTQGSNSTHTVS